MQKNLVIRKLLTILFFILLFTINVQIIESNQQKSNLILGVDMINKDTFNHPFSDVWEIELEFSEPGGAYDNAFFGEKTNASNGIDSYDVPKTPGGVVPYIRTWFSTSFSSPYNILWKEYKLYPDIFKFWNLSIQWFPSDYSSQTTITLSWDPTLFILSEYISVNLYDIGSGTNASNMLVNSSYAFSCPALAPQNFQIICNDGIDNQPEISNINIVTSDPKDTSIGWENFSCIVTDIQGVDAVYLNLIYPDLHTESSPMVKSDDIYYCNTSLSDVGSYSYHIWAVDVNGNSNISAVYSFELPPNWDINGDHDCSIVDLIQVVNHFDETGIFGWIREDVNNDGDVSIVDLIQVTNHFDETW